jgi:type VI secretion system protein ImpK
MENFHEFYAEVQTLQGRIAAGELRAADARQRLVRLVDRQQKAAASESGTYGAELYLRAKYAMAALADELFLSDPTVAGAWMNELLESAIFGSRCAGEKFFTDIDALVSERSAAAGELARVYLAVLSLGFQGHFRESPDADVALEEYRRKLYRIIYARDARIDPDEKIMPSAYAATFFDSSRSELPYLRPWIITICVVFLLWIVAADLIWRDATAGIATQIDNVLEAAVSIGNSGIGGAR